jgi:deazaflavin-dependent oxidoreductase (nitroreductase family)
LESARSDARKTVAIRGAEAMPPIHYGTLNSVIQQMASTRPGAWIVAHTLHWVDQWVLKLSSGRATLSGRLAGVPVITLIAIGARSGQPRQCPLLPIHDPLEPGRFALIASNFGQHHFPAWYYNLKAHPDAACVVNGRAARYLAHEATAAEYERFWQRAVDIYAGYRLYKQRAGRRIPIMVMERES